jgi:transcriptional regulator with XRE-family HTH domain
MSFHTRIKNRRTALFPSQEAFAHALEVNYGLKVSWQSVQQWEREGGTAPNRSRMPAVVAALKTTPEWLLYGTGDEAVEGQSQPQHLKLSAPIGPPPWIDAEAYRLLDLYYALNERKRGEVLRFIEGLRSKGGSTAASGEG